MKFSTDNQIEPCGIPSKNRKFETADIVFELKGPKMKVSDIIIIIIIIIKCF